MVEEASLAALELARLEELICFSAVAALTFSIYDYGLTWLDEVELLWPHSFQSPVKLAFLLNRYGGLLGQIALTMKIVTQSPHTCTINASKQLWVLQVSLFCIAMVSLQAILSLRAYTLYIRDSRVFSSMFVLLAAQIAALPGLAHFTQDMTAGPPGPLCLLPMSTEVGMYYSMIIVPPQIVALSLTFNKYLTGKRAGYDSTQIVTGLLRDDAAVVLVTLSTLVMVIISTKVEVQHSLVLYWWALAIYPAMGSRIIINSQKLAIKQRKQNRFSSVLLTTCVFNVDELDGDQGFLGARTEMDYHQDLELQLVPRITAKV